MKRISAYYDDGINAHKDAAAFTIAKKHGAQLIGGGCWLCAPFTRDLEFSVPEESKAAMKAELEQAGFRLYFEREQA